MESVDQTFAKPYVDIDEIRDAPHPHRFMHGGFEGTDTRFAIYFPMAETYQGRFFQYITPVPLDENLAQFEVGDADRIGFSFQAGAFCLETNNGGMTYIAGTMGDPTIGGFRANAASAIFAKELAQTVYGDHRVYGYAYGGSGGAYRTLGCAENTSGVWDGFAPHVLGSPMAVPNVFSVRMHAQRVLKDKFKGIVDALEPGGSGDPYANLTDEEAEALREVTRMGFPMQSWFAHETMGTQAFGTLYPAIVALDPEYFSDFWTKPGYLGSDPRSSIHKARMQLEATVVEIVRRDTAAMANSGVDDAFMGHANAGTVVALRLDSNDLVDLPGIAMTVTSGVHAGATVAMESVIGGLAKIDNPEFSQPLGQISVGDTVRLDNSNFLAAQTYHRHQVPGREYSVWEQFLGEDGEPRYPQRELLGPKFAIGAAGHLPNGNFSGKMILVESLLDREAYPWQADWYRSRVIEHLGATTGDHFRLWFTENALHGADAGDSFPTHTVQYGGVLHEAMYQLVDWVERGISPSASTEYRVVDGQVQVPQNASDRHGVQPTLSLFANGGNRADVAIDQELDLQVQAQLPDGRPGFVRVDWDLDTDGELEVSETATPGLTLSASKKISFSKPGTYFVGVRVAAQREEMHGTPFGLLENVARARVVVAS